MDLQPGSAFGPYRVVAPLGRGGMAAVYEAHDPSLDRSVALKVLPAEFLHDPAFAERFRQEARVAAKLEPTLFRKTGPKDVADSLKDLKEAIAERGVLDLVPRLEATAVVQVLERGREPAVIGMRKVRVRVVLGRESVELAGQDSMTGFNTWSGAAKGAAKQVESWLKGRLAPGE